MAAAGAALLVGAARSAPRIAGDAGRVVTTVAVGAVRQAVAVLIDVIDADGLGGGRVAAIVRAVAGRLGQAADRVAADRGYGQTGTTR